MPARSAKITIFNATSFIFDKIKGDSSTLCHGNFTSPWTDFPDPIGPNQRVTWQAESGGDIPIIGSVGTGTEGWVKYKVREIGDIVLFHWDVPFEGHIFFGYSASVADDQDPHQLWNADCGDNVAPSGSTFPNPPSRLKFFPLSFAVCASPDCFPHNVPYTPGASTIIGVDQGDIGDEGLITNFAQGIKTAQHAWFQIGVRDAQSTTLRQVSSALGLDSGKGLRASFPGVTVIDVRTALLGL